MNKAGRTQSEIAEAIGFSQSTVSKELKRNRGERGYREKQAETKAAKRKKAKRPRETVMTEEMGEQVEKRLRDKHSPEQISGALLRMGQRVSHETIYRHIKRDRENGGDLYLCLRINGKRRYRRRSKAGRGGQIPGRVGLEKRPAVVEKKVRYGDWEADLIEGRKGTGYLLSLYERKSQLGKLIYLETKSAKSTTSAIIEALSHYRVKTITYDNGLEFSGHLEVTEVLGAKGYFCAPYHSWEKGGVENFNGLVRQYYPKGSDFSTITGPGLEASETQLNERPRKSLGYLSPLDLESKFVA